MSELAVVIPIYKELDSKSEKFSVESTIDILKSRHIYFIAPHCLRYWIEEYTKNLQKERQLLIFDIYFDDNFFVSKASYNKLMLSLAFYKNFINYKYILIVQTDALVLRDNLDEWMSKDYSYIGAPWFEGWDNPVRPLRFIGSGNGGFSLRKVKDFIHILESPRYVPNILARPNKTRKGLLYFLDTVYKLISGKLIYAYNFWPLFPRVNEDVFWGVLVPNRYNFFKVPEPHEAAFFSFEVEPAYLYELTNHQLPIGCHAWEKYGYQFWKKVLGHLNIP